MYPGILLATCVCVLGGDGRGSSRNVLQLCSEYHDVYSPLGSFRGLWAGNGQMCSARCWVSLTHLVAIARTGPRQRRRLVGWLRLAVVWRWGVEAHLANRSRGSRPPSVGGFMLCSNDVLACSWSCRSKDLFVWRFSFFFSLRLPLSVFGRRQRKKRKGGK